MAANRRVLPPAGRGTLRRWFLPAMVVFGAAPALIAAAPATVDTVAGSAPVAELVGVVSAAVLASVVRFVAFRTWLVPAEPSGRGRRASSVAEPGAHYSSAAAGNSQ